MRARTACFQVGASSATHSHHFTLCPEVGIQGFAGILRLWKSLELGNGYHVSDLETGVFKSAGQTMLGSGR